MVPRLLAPGGWERALTLYGTYNAVLGLLDLPVSLIAGLLWQGLSPSAPFFFGAALALGAALLMLWWRPAPSIR